MDVRVGPGGTFMRRSLVLVLLVGLLAALGVPPALARGPGQGAGAGAGVDRDGGAAVFQLTFHGGIAIASWTTCPEWEVGMVCEETVVIASDARTSERWPEGRERDRGPRVVLQRFLFEVVDLGDELATRPLRESFGGTDDAFVAIDTQARRAVARAATIPMSTTDYLADVQYDETASLDVTLTATGPRTALRDHQVASGPGWHVVSRTRGWERDAAGTGTVDGAPIPGTLSSATIVHARQSELRVYPPTRR
jgi:hypothetical protein